MVINAAGKGSQNFSLTYGLLKFKNLNVPLIFFFIFKFKKNVISNTCRRRVRLHNSDSNAIKLHGLFLTYFKIFILFRLFRKKIWKRLLASSCLLCVRPSVIPHRTTRLPLEGFSWNFISTLFQNQLRNFKIQLNVRRVTGNFHK